MLIDFQPLGAAQVVGALSRQRLRHFQSLAFGVGAMGCRDNLTARRRRLVPPNRKCKDAKHNNLRRSKHDFPPMK